MSLLTPFRCWHVYQERNSLLICCLEGEVVEIDCPQTPGHDADVAKTFRMATQTIRTYKFLSIKSKILVAFTLLNLNLKCSYTRS